jgi:histidyl-tRNA synthetase
MSGVGISYGAERIYDVLQELDRFPKEIASPVKVLFLNFGRGRTLCFRCIAKKIRTSVFPAKYIRIM